jgi:dTMP kinase
MEMNNSKFISFEGIDFSGKTTQIELLTKRLQDENNRVFIVREPGGTDISEQIRTILLDRNFNEMTDICEVFLYSAARNQLINEKILKELGKGNFVIADRFVDSTTAYQGFGRQIPLELIRDINHAATGDLLPSLTFILDIHPDEIRDRMQSRDLEIDRLESAGEEFYQRVHKGYHKIAELDPLRVKIINGHESIEKIHDRIWEFVITKIDSIE